MPKQEKPEHQDMIGISRELLGGGIYEEEAELLSALKLLDEVILAADRIGKPEKKDKSLKWYRDFRDMKQPVLVPIPAKEMGKAKKAVAALAACEKEVTIIELPEGSRVLEECPHHLIFSSRLFKDLGDDFLFHVEKSLNPSPKMPTKCPITSVQIDTMQTIRDDIRRLYLFTRTG